MVLILEWLRTRKGWYNNHKEDFDTENTFRRPQPKTNKVSAMPSKFMTSVNNFFPDDTSQDSVVRTEPEKIFKKKDHTNLSKNSKENINDSILLRKATSTELVMGANAQKSTQTDNPSQNPDFDPTSRYIGSPFSIVKNDKEVQTTPASSKTPAVCAATTMPGSNLQDEAINNDHLDRGESDNFELLETVTQQPKALLDSTATESDVKSIGVSVDAKEMSLNRQKETRTILKRPTSSDSTNAIGLTNSSAEASTPQMKSLIEASTPQMEIPSASAEKKRARSTISTVSSQVEVSFQADGNRVKLGMESETNPVHSTKNQKQEKSGFCCSFSFCDSLFQFIRCR